MILRKKTAQNQGDYTMLNISEQLTLVYCLVDDGLKSEKNAGKWRKSNHNPKCTDAEIMAVVLMQSYFGCATLKRTYLLVKANDLKAFPHLPSYKQWLARWHRLSFQMGVFRKCAIEYQRFR